MMINRDKVLEYATAYWWRPCKDGKVYWRRNHIILANEAKAAKAAKEGKKPAKVEDYVGVFLWYPGKKGEKLEALCLVPESVAKKFEKDDDDDARTWAKYKDVAIPLASYSDDPEEDNLPILGPKPPYTGLDDCTHFTSECLIAGGFPVVSPKDAAKRGAGDLAYYLKASKKDVTTLCWMVSREDVQAVVDAAIVRAGDVFAYHDDEKTPAHHTVPAVTTMTIAMHTYRAFNIKWDDIGGPKERYSLFHFKDDKYTTPQAKQWLGWWKVETLDNTKVTRTDYYHFDDDGTLTATTTPPKAKKEKPDGDSYRWFSTKANTAVVVRADEKKKETKVETFTLQPKDAPLTAKGAVSNPPKGSKPTLKGTKQF